MNAHVDVVATAADAVRSARAAFEIDVNDVNYARVRDAEAALAREKDFAAARMAAAKQALFEKEHQAQGAARARQDELARLNDAAVAKLAARFSQLVGHVEVLNTIVTSLEEPLLEMAGLAREHRALQGTAATSDPIKTISLESLRLACGLAISRKWDDLPVNIGAVDFSSARRATWQLNDAGDASTFCRAVQNFVMEVEHCFGGAPLNRWWACIGMPDWQDHSPAAARVREAAKLLERLTKAGAADET